MKRMIALVLTLGLAASAAQAGTTRYNMLTVCKFDMEQYCKNIPKARLRDLRECLAKQEKNLLPQCQDHYKEAR
jgi:hypothetical protein